MFILEALTVFMAILWLLSGGEKVLSSEPGVKLLGELGWPNAPTWPIQMIGVVELATAGGWVLAPRWAEWATVAMLGAYSVTMARLVIRRSAADCACGGLLGNSRVSWMTVGRNLFLIILAILAGGRPGSIFPSDPQRVDAVLAGVWAAAFVFTAAHLLIGSGDGAQRA